MWKKIFLKTRQTIWIFTTNFIFGCSKLEDNFFGENTSKLFEAINQEEFKDKLEATVNDMQNIFDFSNIDLSDMPDLDGMPIYQNKSKNLPDVEKLHDSINSMLEEK